MPFMYIARCRDASFYVGSTEKDPDARIWEHNHDEDLASRHAIRRRPLVLVYTEHFDRIEEAFRRKRQVHGWSRAKKIALIEGRFADLPGLARSKSGPTAP